MTELCHLSRFQTRAVLLSVLTLVSSGCMTDWQQASTTWQETGRYQRELIQTSPQHSLTRSFVISDLTPQHTIAVTETRQQQNSTVQTFGTRPELTEIVTEERHPQSTFPWGTLLGLVSRK